MKKLLIAGTIFMTALVFQENNSATASNREWSTVSKILVGSGMIIRDIVDDDCYYYDYRYEPRRYRHHRYHGRRYYRRPIIIIRDDYYRHRDYGYCRR